MNYSFDDVVRINKYKRKDRILLLIDDSGLFHVGTKKSIFNNSDLFNKSFSLIYDFYQKAELKCKIEYWQICESNLFYKIESFIKAVEFIESLELTDEARYNVTWGVIRIIKTPDNSSSDIAYDIADRRVLRRSININSCALLLTKNEMLTKLNSTIEKYKKEININFVKNRLENNRVCFEFLKNY